VMVIALALMRLARLSRIGLRTAARERQATVRRTTPGYFRRVAMNKA